jgi:hypothetical protein
MTFLMMNSVRSSWISISSGTSGIASMMKY